MRIVVTGHRPDKLLGYSETARDTLYKFAHDLFSDLKRVGNIECVTSGMAQGWDMAVTQACIDLKIPLHAYIPFQGQESRWPEQMRSYYSSLLNQATQVKVVCMGGFAAWKMQARNKAMVEASTHMIALWDGSTGGTFNCWQYAGTKYPKENRVNMWPEFQAYIKEKK